MWADRKAVGNSKMCSVQLWQVMSSCLKWHFCNSFLLVSRFSFLPSFSIFSIQQYDGSFENVIQIKPQLCLQSYMSFQPGVCADLLLPMPYLLNIFWTSSLVRARFLIHTKLRSGRNLISCKVYLLDSKLCLKTREDAAFWLSHAAQFPIKQSREYLEAELILSRVRAVFLCSSLGVSFVSRAKVLHPTFLGLCVSWGWMKSKVWQRRRTG